MRRTSSSHWAVERTALAIVAAMAVGLPSTIRAQDTSQIGPYSKAVATWISLIATPGYEKLATERILSATREGWTRDRIGNLVKRVGDGSPRRVLACAIDETGYAVSEITDDGYLRVHVNGNGRHPALWDQYHEGQRVVVLAVDRSSTLKTRPVPGVFAVRSNHLWRRRVADDAPTSIENLWLDVGARSRAEVERMGISVLDPVVRDWPEWTYADYVSGPAAGSRAGCAAVAAASSTNNRAGIGETIYVISTQKGFSWAGLTGALAGFGRVDSLVIDDPTLLTANGVERHDIRAPWARAGEGGQKLDIGSITAISLPRRFAGTLIESIRETDIKAFFLATIRAVGQSGDSPTPIRVARGFNAAPPVVTRDSLSRYADLLAKLTDIYAVSGHEAPMRDAVQAALPTWAKSMATVDTAGNLVLAMGPNRDTTVVVAHLDEIGFVVTKIGTDGTLSLRQRGTFFPFLWEGQTALLHRPDDKPGARDGRLGCDASREGPMRGVFLTRDSSSARNPATVSAWMGRDSAQLVADGVHVGSVLTSYKCSARLGDVRFTARSVDDRAGDTALLLALDDIVPSQLDHKVIFMWSVREEGGLEGAKAAAAVFGPSVHRVHAVDTFVSSDSPLESRRFAYGPIGQGALVRALDNSSVTPPDEIDRVLRIARAGSIPLQPGVTNGGNDGSEFARYGALDVALAWPLRYSHSPAEVIDLRDLRSLSRIVAAVAKAPTRTSSGAAAPPMR